MNSKAFFVLLLSISILTVPVFAKHGHHRMWLEKFDSNDNGVIEYAEFEEKIVDKFNRIDANGDGLITGEERSGSYKHHKHRKHTNLRSVRVHTHAKHTQHLSLIHISEPTRPY